MDIKPLTCMLFERAAMSSPIKCRDAVAQEIMATAYNLELTGETTLENSIRVAAQRYLDKLQVT